MRFELLIAYYRIAGTEIKDLIRDCLAQVLDDNLNEFDDEAV